ncbi:MAG: PLP-dependent aminotransferase family protein [Vicinamibacteria bacterium]
MAATSELLPLELGKDTPWRERYAQRCAGVKGSLIRELLKLTEQPDVISFGGGLPAPEVFPIAEIQAAADRVLQEHGAHALQYGPTEGYRPLRELLVRHLGRYGIRVGAENLLVTSGSQQALDLIGKLFVNPGDHLLVENPTYLGALQAFRAYQAEFLTVPLDDAGMDVSRLEEALRRGPKFVYVLPNFQNPAGVTLGLERRRRLVELAGRYGVPILEDDPYGQLRYEGVNVPPIVQIDAEVHGCGHRERSLRGGVIYLGTLSKVLAPGLRLGFVVAPEEVIQRLVLLKQGADLHTATFNQMVAYEAARGGFLDRHVRRIRSVYGARRDAMLGALAAHMPEGVSWTRPQGGLFLWVTLPSGLDAAKVLESALREKVAFVPGSAFHACGGGENTLRMNFSYCSPERAAEGVERLGKVIRAAIAG